MSLDTSQTFRVTVNKNKNHCVRIVRVVIERGINFFDTAPIYWDSESVLGFALEGYRDKVIIATKVKAEDAKEARESIDRSFEVLRTDVIDLLQIHSMESWQEVTPVIQMYQRQGRVRFIGLTESNPDNYLEVLKAMSTGPYDTGQILYSLVETVCCKKLLPLARTMNIGVIGLRATQKLLADQIPFCPAIVTDGTRKPKKTGVRERMQEAHHQGSLSFLENYGVEIPGQALLKYVLSHSEISTIIVATGKIERIAENVAASNGHSLPTGACRRLEEICVLEKYDKEESL